MDHVIEEAMERIEDLRAIKQAEIDDAIEHGEIDGAYEQAEIDDAMIDEFGLGGGPGVNT